VNQGAHELVNLALPRDKPIGFELLSAATDPLGPSSRTFLFTLHQRQAEQ